ncbi:MAG TPA: aminoacyl-histidine dipeptidase [Phycisphaerae bacterium]|nr:aminoacyl-histidine dipeptidase [Phycisphaerae bacterium]HNU47010.1 aminoacyl-histidine dipeptidase [Phycisphaerae bacterium]
MSATQPQRLEDLEPAPVWRFFAGMAAVPRNSKKEEKIRAHVKNLARQYKLTCREDSVGNLVIDVPATPGHEQAPVTVLQGHLDMVCEKNSGTQHDFDRDPIKLVLGKDRETSEAIVRADGTTLGADNGIGVALAFAAATEPGVVHGPLELLLTVDEEQGMTGAKVLEPAFLRGRRMLNLDSEEDDAIYIGCAGGCDANLAWSLKATAPDPNATVVMVTIAGLRGGHSGGDIHLNRANAIKLLARTLRDSGVADLRLALLQAGSKRNVIPREAKAVLTLPAKGLAALKETAGQVQAETVREAGEAQCTIKVDAAGRDQAPGVLSTADTQRLLDTLLAIPSGVLAVNPAVPGLVQTSNNLSVVGSEYQGAQAALRLEIQTLSRSSAAFELDATIRQISAIGRLAGATVTTGNSYPGWQPDLNSAMLDTGRKVYEKLFGQAPKVTAIHAGLECGIIGERLGGMDMISFGPRIKGAHSPEERVYIASVQKSWKFVTAFLAAIA